MITNKIKLFLLLTFGFVFLVAQNSFAAYINHGLVPTTIENSNNIEHCSSFKSGSQDQWSNLSENEFCLFTNSDVANKWDKYSTVVALRIDRIQIPYYVAKNLWRTVETSQPIYPNSSMANCAQSTDGGEKPCFPTSAFVPVSALAPTFVVPQIYDNVKTEIIRSCLPGKISTSIKSSANISACCLINKYKAPRDIRGTVNASIYPTFTYPGCGPLKDAINLSVENKTEDPVSKITRLGIGEKFTLVWSLSNPSATCELKGFDANAINPTETLISKVTPDKVGINVRTGAITPFRDQTTYGNPKMGIYTYTYTCAGVLDGKNSPPSDTDKPIIIERRVFVGNIPNEPKINSFTIKKADGTSFPTTNIGGENVPTITQTDSFKVCWNTTTENPKITVRVLKDLAQIKKTEITPTTTNPNILTACLPSTTLPSTDAAGVSPIGLWNYELEVGNSIWSDKGLGSDTRNIALNVIPIDPVIEKFEVVDSSTSRNATTSVSVSAKVRLHWIVKNTKHIAIDGDNFSDDISASINSTNIEGYSDLIQPNDSDSTSPYTYTLKADDLFYPNRTITATTKLYRNQPGKPTISKFEFDKPSAIKKTTGSGSVGLTWIVSGAKSILVEGPGLQYGGATYTSATKTVQISIDNPSVSIGESKYSITACPTSTSNSDNCSTADTTLKVYSSEAISANLSADDAIVGTGKSTTLRWDVAKNDKIKSYSITSNSGDIIAEYSNTGTGLELSKIITPTAKTTTYTLNVQSIDPNLIPDFSISATVETANAPKINSFTIKKADGSALPTTEIGGENVPTINQTESFKLCWNAETENPKITVAAFKNSAQEEITEIQAGLITCVEKKLPPTDLPIGLWNYKLEIKNSVLFNKGLASAAKELSLNVTSVAPKIEKFEVLDSFGNATTSVLISEPITLSWRVINTNNVKVDGNNYNKSFSAGLNSTIIDDHSEKILPNESDLSSPYIYTITAGDLYYTNQPITESITLQRRQSGAPNISKFEFDKSAVTKKVAGGSGYVALTWIVDDAKLVTIEGTKLPFSTTPYQTTGKIDISVDDLSVAPEGLEYSITACPTSAPGVNCSTSKTILKVYSSDTFGANLYADDAMVRIGNSTTLRWDVAQNDKIKSYSIISSSGDVNLTENAETGLRPSGSIEITPKIETKYTLTIQSQNPTLINDFSVSVTVGTTDKNSPSIEFSADKTEINKGDAVVLSWNAKDAKEVIINNNVGSVAKQGSTTIYPDFTTLYILTAKSAQPGIIPDSEKTVQIKVLTPGFEGLKTADEWANPTDLKTQYGLSEEAEANAKLGILDLKVNGVDGPITVTSPANITLSWNLDKYCLATGSWLTVKTTAGTENMTLKKNGKYTYNLYCPGTGSDSVEVTVTGGQGGLLNNLLGKNGSGKYGENGEDSMPIAEIAVSTDKIVFSTDARVIKGKEVELFIRADKDIDGDGKASRDQNGEWGALLSNGGGCLYNTKLTRDLQFDGGVQSPKSPQDCNASLGKFTFNDEPGTYQYGVLKLVQNDGKFSNIGYITITVDGPPAPNSAPTIDFRVNGKDTTKQTFGTPANYYMTWDVADADSCLATGSWNGIKPLKGIQNFLKSSNDELAYTLTCENELGISAKTIALKIVESPVCTFTAMPPTIDKKSAFITESELSWKCNYTDECDLSPNASNTSIKTYGSLRVSPDQTTNYTLNCTSSNISKSFEAKVEVSQ